MFFVLTMFDFFLMRATFFDDLKSPVSNAGR